MRNERNDRLLKRLLAVQQILFVRTIGDVQRIIWKIKTLTKVLKDKLYEFYII